MSRGFFDEVAKATAAPMRAAGFRKRQEGLFTIEVADGVLGVVGLNHASRRWAGRVEVNPVIGARHQAVEQLVAELREERFHQYLPPTVSEPLGYLRPERKYTPFMFDPDETLAARAAAMADAIAEHGLPFMRAAASLGEMRRLLEAGYNPSRAAADCRLPVVCLLDGDREGALRAVEATMERIAGQYYPAAVLYRDFAGRFRAYTRQRPSK